MQCLFKLSKCLLYIVVKCDRLTFICDKKKTASCRTECGKFICSLLLLLFLEHFFCDLLISNYVSTQCPHLARSYFKTKIVDSSFCFSFSGRTSGAGGVSATLNAVKDEIMSFLMISDQFSLQGWFLFGSCGTFTSLCAHICTFYESRWNYIYI